MVKRCTVDIIVAKHLKINEKMRDYSGRIKKILKEKGLSVADFCTLIGLNSTGTIHKLITDNRKPSGKTVNRIITAFPDISEKWLLYGKEEDKQAKEEDERTVTAQQVIDYIKKKSKKDRKEIEKLKQAVLIMHENALETTEKVNYLVQKLDAYLK